MVEEKENWPGSRIEGPRDKIYPSKAHLQKSTFSNQAPFPNSPLNMNPSMD
jgi:hypothetical protein